MCQTLSQVSNLRYLELMSKPCLLKRLGSTPYLKTNIHIFIYTPHCRPIRRPWTCVHTCRSCCGHHTLASVAKQSNIGTKALRAGLVCTCPPCVSPAVKLPRPPTLDPSSALSVIGMRKSWQLMHVCVWRPPCSSWLKALYEWFRQALASASGCITLSKNHDQNNDEQRRDVHHACTARSASSHHIHAHAPCDRCPDSTAHPLQPRRPPALAQVQLQARIERLWPCVFTTGPCPCTSRTAPAGLDPAPTAVLGSRCSRWQAPAA